MNFSSSVHSLWIGKIGEIEQLCINSFSHHGFVFNLWTYDELFCELPGVKVRNANQILDRSLVYKIKQNNSPSVAAFSDLFRYKLLHEFGGIWVDMDNVCLNSFNIQGAYCFPSLSSWYLLGREKSEYGGKEIDSWFIKAPKGSDAMKYCFDTSYELKETNPPWGTFGPCLLNKAVRKYDLLKYASDQFMPINWNFAHYYVDRNILFRNYFNFFKRRSYTAHLYREVLNRRGLLESSQIKKNSVLGILLKNMDVSLPVS